jgi:hypothetical protein
MRIFYSLLFLSMINILIIGCINTPSTPVKASESKSNYQKKRRGRIEFSEELHNFGTLKEGEIVAYSFQFKNAGDESFHLVSVEPSCGCLVVKFNQEEVHREEVSTVEVVFHTAQEWGNQMKVVDIETSIGEKKSLTLVAFIENKNFNIDLK